jgi:hypothetical protein
MEIVKKNLFSIIFGVIAILAVAALFWPISGMYDSQAQLLQQRIDVSGRLDSVSNQQRNMPLLSPDQTQAAPLEVFPTQPVIDVGTAATAEVAKQAKAMLDLAKTTNSQQHLPLASSPDELPKPSEQARFNFANVYGNTVTNYQRWIDIVDATAPPTPAEVDAEKAKLKEQIDKQRLVYDAQNNIDPTSQQEATDQYTAESAGVQTRMELDSAGKHRVYLLQPPTFNPLPVNQKIKVGYNPTPEDICDAQIVVWVLDDLMNGIARANELYSDLGPDGKPQHDIFHSAVKSIEGVDPPQPVISPNAGDLTAGSGSAVPKVTSVSPTGRVCNGLYDTLRYKVRLVVDAAKIPDVIRALEAQQFITVVNVQVNEIIDPAVAASSPQGGMHYGNKPAARVEFDCEELLMRGWTDQYLPDDRKGGLGKGALGQPTDNGGGNPYGPGGMGGPGGPYGPGPGGPYGAPPQ